MNTKKILIGSDHAGYSLKNKIKEYLEENGYLAEDKGTDSEESVDYPDFIHPVASGVSEGKTRFGIIICGSGNGAAMTANKHKNVRAAICWSEEIAELARMHNDANIISLPARFVNDDQALKILSIFLNTEFEGGRHQNRIQKINL